MIYTQPRSEVNLLGYRCVGVYYDEVSLEDARGYGLGRATHVASLAVRSGDRTVVAAKFEFRPGSAHPSYGTIIASVTGDEYVNTTPETPSDAR